MKEQAMERNDRLNNNAVELNEACMPIESYGNHEFRGLWINYIDERFYQRKNGHLQELRYYQRRNDNRGDFVLAEGVDGHRHRVYWNDFRPQHVVMLLDDNDSPILLIREGDDRDIAEFNALLPNILNEDVRQRAITAVNEINNHDSEIVIHEADMYHDDDDDYDDTINVTDSESDDDDDI